MVFRDEPDLLTTKTQRAQRFLCVFVVKGDGKMQRFVKVLNAGDLEPGQAKVVRVENKQIAVFRLEDNKFCAVDNRCPHEGYPLVQGTVTDCTLTCDWHNWKFDLQDGHCLRGGEDVRYYPVEIESGEIRLDIADPEPQSSIPQFLKSLQAAMAENDDSRAARDIIRLLKLGFDEKKIVAEAARYGAAHDGEGNDFHGWDHGMAVLVDCARVLDLYEGYERVIPLAQGVSAMAEPRLRQGLRPVPEAADISGYASPASARAEFRRLVETEQPEEAESLFRGIVAAGASPEEIKASIFSIATDHFLSYGHRMIYAVKAFQLLDIIGWENAAEVLPCLVTATVWGTREDRLPYMRKFQARLREVEPELPDLFARQSGASAELDESRFRKTLLDGKQEEVFEVVDGALRAGVPITAIVRATVLAAAERCLRFNIAVDRDKTLEEGWLDVTHCLTYAGAVREALEMWPDPELLRALYHAAYFVNYTRKPQRTMLDLPPERRESVSDPQAAFDWSDLASLTDEELLSRLEVEIDDLQYREAMRTTRAYLELGRPRTKLTSRLIKYALADSAAVPIVLAHTIKMTVAAVEEFNALGNHPHNWLPMLAAVRFLASPKLQRFAYRGARQAIDFIANSNAKEA
jgi:nitrite reductase/ring-hydroxylating ferredoxin subunit